MNTLIQPPQVSQEIINKIVESIAVRYELKEIIPTKEFSEDTARVFEQFELYSSTILQLHTRSNVSSCGLLEQFHQNMFKFMRFTSKLITKLSKNQMKEVQLPRVQQICVACQDNLQYRNIKLAKKELYNFNLPNYDRKWENADQDKSQTLKDQEEVISNEDILVRKMTKLQKNLNDRQIGLMRCLQEFQTVRSQMMTDLISREQPEKECLSKFDYRDYAFKLSWFFTNELKKIEDKINSLKLSIKRQEDKGVQVICVEMGISRLHENIPLSLLKHQSQNSKLGGTKAEVQLKKSNEARLRLEELVKRFQVESKEMSTKVQVLQDQIKTLNQQIFEQKLKNAIKSKSIKPIEKPSESKSKSKKLLEEEKSKQNHITNSQIINEDKGLVNKLQDQILEEINDLQLSKNKVKDVLPLFKQTFKKTVDTYINQRMNSTVDRKKLLKFQNNDEETMQERTQERRVSKKRSSRFLMDRPAMREGSRFGPLRNTNNFKITSQCALKIMPKGKRQVYRQERSSQVSRTQDRRESAINYKKSKLSTEGDINKNSHLRFASMLYEPKKLEIMNQNRDLTLTKKKSKQLRESQTNFQSQMLLACQVNQKKLKMLRLNRNSSQESIHPACKVTKSKLSFNDIIQVYKIDCNLMDYCVIKNFIRNQQATSEGQNNQQQIISKTEVKDLSKFSPGREETSFQSSHAPLKKGFMEKIILRIDQINYLTNFFTLMARAHVIHPKLYDQLKTSLFQQSAEGSISESNGNSMMMKQMLGQIILRHRKCLDTGLCSHMQDFLLALQQSLAQKTPLTQSN